MCVCVCVCNDACQVLGCVANQMRLQHINVYMYICTYVYMYIYMCVYIYIYIYIPRTRPTLRSPSAAAESECKQYAYFSCWFACMLLEKLPSVLVASYGHTYEWIVGSLLLPAIEGGSVHPALRYGIYIYIYLYV